MPYAVYTKEGDDEDGESQEVYVFLPEKVLPLPSAENIGHSKACIMDFSGKFSENAVITETALRQKATAYANSATLGVPKVSITVSFVQLWQTEEYKNIAPLERVKLCDTVTVRFPSLGVKASAKVIKTVYNVLEEKYESIELGDAKSSLADTLNKQQADIAQLAESIIKGNAKVTDELKKAVKNATELITGQAGGYVVLNPAEKPQEILILDKPAIEEAISVWRWNSAGLGHSSTGYNGTYALAMTMDGAFVADFITVGTLNGALLKADSVQASAISAEYKQEVTDAIGNVESSVTQAFKISDEQLLSKISETKTYAEQQAQTAENAANEATDEKLSNYSSTIEMNSAIEQKANSITLSVSEQVSETKTYAEQQAQAAENAANKATDKKLSEYSTTTEMNSAIEVVSNRLALLVTETDNGDVINSASIIAAINDGESGITLNANKINLTAYPKTTDLSLSVTNDYGGDEKKSRLYLKCDGKTVDSATISLTGIVSFTDLEESGSTVINGDNIATGTISADYISTEISQVNGNLYVGNYGDNVSKQIIFSKGAKISTVSESIGGYYGLSISGVVVKIGTRLDLTDCTDISWGDNYPTAKFG
jgi:phage-related protein